MGVFIENYVQLDVQSICKTTKGQSCILVCDVCDGGINFELCDDPLPVVLPWWRHEMEAFPASLAICAGNSPVTGEFHAHLPVTRSFVVFFDLRLNTRLSKQSWGWWYERSRRADYDVTVMTACNNMFSNMNMSKLIILCKCNSSCKDLMVTISSILIYQISDFGTSDRNNYWSYLLIPQVDIGDKENNNSSDI